MWNRQELDKLYSDVLPKLSSEAFCLSDYIAAHPEIGEHEFESSKRLVNTLRSHGIEVEYPFCGMETAFKAQINKTAPRRFALLAEYDALRGIGHGCGHCASGTATILTALALNSAIADADVGVDVIGTPDEEINGAKCVMADQGVFKDYDFVAMAHMGANNSADVKFMALDGTTIEFLGVAAHAAQAPEQGRNALNAARLFMDATDMMRQHIIQEARLHGYIVNGGTASNIVPDHTVIEFLSRAPSRKDLTYITEWVYDCARAAALATKTKCEIKPCGHPFDDLFMTAAEHELMQECFDDLGMKTVSGGATSGSSDIGNVSYICPAFHPYISIGQNFQVHTTEFAQAMTDERTHTAILNAAKYLLMLAFKLYGDPGRLERIKQEHKECLKNPH